ncbi:hypothetical protein [Catenuloplanes japonicus]|uniref:hypothetical protein n=1 Tax=Catenuloplanes japonicus TaxID=33876 RepID=UPI000527E96C|nr:hypothetical protein [Catenuloplanes japonicus]
MSAAELAAAAETDVLFALAAGRTVLVEAGWVWADSMPVADENTALDLAERGLVREVGTQLQLTADGTNRAAELDLHAAGGTR